MNSNKVIIIAEAGVNHNGDRRTAEKLIKVAAEAGADFVKFQTFNADKIVSRKAKKAEYQSNNVESGSDDQYSMLKSVELSDEDHQFIIKKCEENNIRFLSTAFDEDGIDYLDQLGLPFFKSPSGEITNYPYLRKLGQKGKPVILSTGMATMQEVKDAISVLNEFGLKKEDLTVLHCNTEYPTPMEDVNLKAMNTIAEELDVKVGYSDHTLGIEVPIAAVARGAQVIEKHFTLDRELPGPDHRASLEPKELKAMVEGIRNIEKALSGDGTKKPSKSEQKNIDIARKSIHLARNVKKGDVLTEKDIIPLRPGDGISPMEWNNVIGKMVLKPLSKNEQLTWDTLQ
ncbi:N-acetylneuraminate synthase [Aliifodinibius salicampi]|uniref:N-acetylneuraminate synthase n=1 Tax=Fodinibius salicampi TaxID=1920655 RepID=A0ABT3PYW9_9BACT|nr:N-acetylneuraminate synthase [Fodinibius salicampi]MCW9713062.1 N-acetylneuraminate synthase [Fodinibius salicampi]